MSQLYFKALGLDPGWSVRLAKRYCANAAWVYVDTTPFYALVRYGGASLGLAAVYHHHRRQQQEEQQPAVQPYQRRLGQLIQLTLGLLLGELGVRARAQISRDSLLLFYALQLALSALSVISIVILPYYVSTAMYPSPAKDVRFKK
jgi:hypothetical protein